MPDNAKLPNVLTTPGSAATDVMQLCADKPVQMIIAGVFCGCLIEACTYLVGNALHVVKSYVKEK